MQLWLCPLFAFLLGSIPFGLIIAKLKGINIREHGSGNIGATNVLRVVGKKYGITCLILDALKGFIPVVIAINLIHIEGKSPLLSSHFLDQFALHLPVAEQFKGQLIHVLTALAAILGAALPAAAEDAYPNRAIKILVPIPPGGAPDVVARLVGNYLSQAVGQPRSMSATVSPR